MPCALSSSTTLTLWGHEEIEFVTGGHEEGSCHGSVQALSTQREWCQELHTGARCCAAWAGAGHAGDPGVCMSEERQRAHTAGVPVGEVKQRRNPSVGRAAIVGSEVTQQHSRSLSKCSISVKFHWIQSSPTFEKTTHFSTFFQKLPVEIQ